MSVRRDLSFEQIEALFGDLAIGLLYYDTFVATPDLETGNEILDRFVIILAHYHNWINNDVTQKAAIVELLNKSSEGQKSVVNNEINASRIIPTNYATVYVGQLNDGVVVEPHLNMYGGINWDVSKYLSDVIAHKLAESTSPVLRDGIVKECCSNTVWKIANGKIYLISNGIAHEPREGDDMNYATMQGKKCSSLMVDDQAMCKQWIDCILDVSTNVEHCLNVINNPDSFKEKDLDKLCETHPQLVMRALKKMGFKLKNDDIFGADTWRVMTLEEWIKGKCYTHLFKTDELLNTAQKRNPVFFKYIATLACVANKHNYIALTKNSQQSIATDFTLPYRSIMFDWSKHMGPLVLSTRKILSPTSLMLRGMRDVGTQMGGNIIIPYSPNGSITFPNVYPTGMVGGFSLIESSRKQHGGQLLIKNRLEKDSSVDKLRQMFLSATNVLKQKGVVITDADKFFEQLDKADANAIEINKVLKSLGVMIELANRYGIDNKQLSLSNIMSMASRANSGIAKYRNREQSIIQMLIKLNDKIDSLTESNCQGEVISM